MDKMTALVVLGFTCLVWGLSAVQCSDTPAPPPLPSKSPVQTPPPVVIYLAQKEEGEHVQEVPAPPPVALYHSQQQQHQQNFADRPLEEEWALPSGYNREQLGNMADSSLLENIVYDMQSGTGGLAALKDDDMQVCFIDHFIRPFIVPHEQRRFYTHSLPATLTESDIDHHGFRSMVGQHIYNMCRGIRTYWLDNKLLFEYENVLQGVRGVGSSTGSEAGVPPPVSLYHALQEQQQAPGPVRAAPPAQPETTPVLNVTPAPEVKAPPPVAVYRQQNP